MIAETRVVLSSHQAPSSSPSARAINRQLGLLLTSIFPALTLYVVCINKGILGIDGYTKGDPLYLLSGLLSDYYGPD